MTEFFQAKGMSKSYPGVKANDRIDIIIKAGEIHALLGENGSGKSTLVKTIYGLTEPDEGRMWLRNQRYDPKAPQQARAAGVAMVFQHFSLFDALTVAENIELGMDSPPKRSRLVETIQQTSQQYGLPINPDQKIGDLSVGERQRVEIIRCLMQNPQLLIMDEPTSVLTPQEANILFSTLRKLSAEGTAILYISHKLEEIRALCQSTTILREGKVVNVCDPKVKSSKQLAEMMVGSSVATPSRQKHATKTVPLLRAKNLSIQPESAFGVHLHNVNFAVHTGELLGIAGMAGNGQEELVLALSGESHAVGSLMLGEHQLIGKSPRQRRRMGLVTAHEERLGHAAAANMNLIENAYLTADIRMTLTRSGVVDWQKTKTFAQKIKDEFDVRTNRVENQARSLSGGNLQKFVIGREILQNPSVLVANQPTWGVDAAAASFIRQSLLDLAAAGAAVIVISQDLDELIEISASIAVLNRGKLSLSKPTENVSRQEIGLLMGTALQGHIPAKELAH